MLFFGLASKKVRLSGNKEQPGDTNAVTLLTLMKVVRTCGALKISKKDVKEK
jgi:hypothetical protein